MSYISSPYNSFSSDNLNYSAYVCPSRFDDSGDEITSREDILRLEQKIVAWLRDAKVEGKNFIESQRTYSNLDDAIDIICGTLNNNIVTTRNRSNHISAETLSEIFVNTIKRDIKEASAILSNIRPSWIYESQQSQDETFKSQATLLNNLSSAWYGDTFVDRRIKDMLQWGLLGGISYLGVNWKPNRKNPCESNIILKPYSRDAVYPVGLSSDNDLQEAYAVIIKEEWDIRRAWRTFTHKKEYINPIKGLKKTNWIDSASDTIQNIIGSTKQNNTTSKVPMVDIHFAYINDYTINKSQKEITMGESSWKYTVPYVGQEILDGYNIDGSTRMRRAKVEDCYLYPNRRLVIATDFVVLYDGPSYYWHGKVPLVKYCPDGWVFSFIGTSAAAELLSMQKSAISMRRAIEDTLNLKLNPPIIMDEQSTSKTKAKSINLRQVGRKIMAKLSLGEVAKPVLSPEYYQVDQRHFEYVAEVENKIGDILGLPDLKSLNQAKQVPSGDSIEKFFASVGAVVTDMSRSMDEPLKEVADMNLYNFMQFYTVNRRIKVLGEAGLVKEDFDFDPGSLIPSRLPNEPPIGKTIYDLKQNPNGVYEFNSTRTQRARTHLLNFRTTITPTSLHQITHIQRKLMMMQAFKLSPFLVSPETLAKVMDIPNWGQLIGVTELEKNKSYAEIQKTLSLESQMDQGKVQLLLQLMAMMLQAQMSPEGMASGALNNIADSLKTALSSNSSVPTGDDLLSPNTNHAGRPGNFDVAPRLEVKDGGTRSIIGSSSRE